MAHEMKKFECWNAEPVYKHRFNPDTGKDDRYLVEVKKKGFQPRYVTNMEQRHADDLNAQVENSGFYYFLVQTD